MAQSSLVSYPARPVNTTLTSMNKFFGSLPINRLNMPGAAIGRSDLSDPEARFMRSGVALLTSLLLAPFHRVTMMW